MLTRDCTAHAKTNIHTDVGHTSETAIVAYVRAAKSIGRFTLGALPRLPRGDDASGGGGSVGSIEKAMPPPAADVGAPLMTPVSVGDQSNSSA
jgi:hypothetical protein